MTKVRDEAMRVCQYGLGISHATDLDNLEALVDALA